MWMLLTTAAIAGGQAEALEALTRDFNQDGVVATPQAVAALYATSCAAGYAPSCSASLWAGSLGAIAAGQWEPAAAVFTPACEQDDAIGCAFLGWRAFVSADYAQAAAAFELACGLGLERGCSDAAALQWLGLGQVVDDAKALPALEAACDAGVGNACMQLGDIASGAGGRTPDPVRAGQVYGRGCGAGDLAACTNLGEALLAGNGVSMDLIAGERELSRACDGGYGRACYDLGVSHTNGPLAVDLAAAAHRFEQGCTWRDRRSCGLRGGLEAADTLAEPWHRAACDLGDGLSCVWLAEHAPDPQERQLYDAVACMDRQYEACERTAQTKAEDSPAEATEYFARACEGGLPTSCKAAGRAYVKGIGVPKDAAIAQGYYQAACAAGDTPACKIAEKLNASAGR